MTTKIYIGSNENVIIPITKQTVRYTIEFYDNPTVSTFFNVNLLNDSNTVMNFYKQFRTSDNTIYYSLREATTEATTETTTVKVAFDYAVDNHPICSNQNIRREFCSLNNHAVKMFCKVYCGNYIFD